MNLCLRQRGWGRRGGGHGGGGHSIGKLCEGWKAWFDAVLDFDPLADIRAGKPASKPPWLFDIGHNDLLYEALHTRRLRYVIHWRRVAALPIAIALVLWVGMLPIIAVLGVLLLRWMLK